MQPEAGMLVGVRLAPDLVRRADALVPKVATDRALTAVGRITRSTVLKLALVRGLDALELEYN